MNSATILGPRESGAEPGTILQLNMVHRHCVCANMPTCWVLLLSALSFDEDTKKKNTTEKSMSIQELGGVFAYGGGEI